MNSQIRNNIMSKIIQAGIIVFSFSLIITSGIFFNETVIEKSADYAAHVVEQKSLSKTYCSIFVDKTDDSGEVLDHFSEFHTLYGTFKQTKATFGSFVNADKGMQIVSPEIDGIKNFSLFYLGAVGTQKYEDHYKTYSYPFEVMFEDSRPYDISRYVIYLSKTQADLVLEKRNVKKTNGNYLLEDYRSLLLTLINIEIDGVEADFVINNIFYESNYYFECMSEAVGDFLLMSYYLPVTFSRTNVYFLSKYSYQNEYFMKYIRNGYSNGKYLVRVNHYNIDGDINDDLITSFYYGTLNQSFEWITYLLVLIGFAALAFDLFLLIKNKFWLNLSNIPVILLSLLLPYSVFKSIYLVTKNVYFFSFFGMRIYLFGATIFIVLLVLIFLVAKQRNKKICLERICFEEIDI